MTTTVLIPHGGSAFWYSRKEELIRYLKVTVGDDPVDDWTGPGWQIRIREWVSTGLSPPLPQLELVKDSAGRGCILVDIDDPGMATLVALKFGF